MAIQGARETSTLERDLGMSIEKGRRGMVERRYNFFDKLKISSEFSDGRCARVGSIAMDPPRAQKMESKQPPTFSIIQNIIPGDNGRVTINKTSIKSILNEGLDLSPPEDRFVAWSALLSIFPNNSADWPDRYRAIKSAYLSYLAEFGLTDYHTKAIRHQAPLYDFGIKDNATMALIHADVVRTGSHILFLPELPIKGSVPEEAHDVLYPVGEHLRRLERLLYVFSRVNPWLGYLQGFNELALPIYYAVVDARRIFKDDYLSVEAVAFQSFNQLLTQFGLCKFFTSQQNPSESTSGLDPFVTLLKAHLPRLEQHLSSIGVYPWCYAIRWFSVLFAQDFSIPDLVVLWDSMISHSDCLLHFAFLVGIGFLYTMEKRLLKCDFAKAMGVLQCLDKQLIQPALLFANAAWAKEREQRLHQNDSISMDEFTIV